jgi:outer membrane protein assembly factor BamB
MKTMNLSQPSRRLVLATALLAACTVASIQAADNWPHWRGPNANGTTTTGQFPTKWDPADVHWKIQLPGKGTSTPIVWNDRIYLTCPSDGQDAVLAFDFSGKLLWETKLGPEIPPKHRFLGSSSNASPITDGNAIFVYFKSGNFAALEFDGTVRWRHNLVEQFGRDQLFWDQGTSPVLTEQHVVMTRMHGGDSWIAGFDKQTGAMQWRQPRNYQVPRENDNGYTTPVLFHHNGTPALLVWGADHLTAHDAANGALLWSAGGFNPAGTAFWPAIASPAIHGNIAVVPVGRDDRDQASVHGIRLGGSGDVTQTHRAWKRDDIGVFVCSPAEYQGRVYLLRDRGGIVCIDPATGRTIWNYDLPTGRAQYYSSPVIANGILYAARQDGVVFVGRVQDKFSLLAEIPMGEPIIASPVPVQNRLLIRGDNHLFCILP